MEPRFNPPVSVVDPPGLDAAGGLAIPPVTILVAAMGESALTVTPAGVVCPICHVSAATARLAHP